MKFSWTSRRRSKGWTAIALHKHRVDLAQVFRGASGRPEVRSFDSYRNDKPDAETLGILRRKHGLGHQRCITPLGSGEYQILQLEAPDVPPAEMKEAVRWRIKDMIDFSPEEATFDLVDMPTNQATASRSRSLQVFCARSAVVSARMKLFDQAKIPLDVIDVPELALRNVAALWANPGKSLALLHIDESGGTLVIVADGDLYASRRIDVTESDLVEGDETQRQSLLDRIALELQRSFDHYDRQFGSLPLEKLLVATPRASELVEYLSPTLYVPVEIADLAGIMDFPAVPELRDPARQAQGLVALGLALRVEQAAP